MYATNTYSHVVLRRDCKLSNAAEGFCYCLICTSAWTLYIAGPIVSPIDVKAALDNRDSLAKTIYSRMFDWLVAKINTAIGQDDTAPTLVGVLDIYGFECFKENDFEQFCINLANEKLQQHFNQHVFKMEQVHHLLIMHNIVSVCSES